jgi:hypothetical protein
MPTSVADLTRLQQERQRAQAYADTCDAEVLKARLTLAKVLGEQTAANEELAKWTEQVRQAVVGV